MSDRPRVLLVATMDTKGQEAMFVRQRLEQAGVAVAVLDGGIRGESPAPVEIGRREVAAAAGRTLEDARNMGHEGKALGLMVEGAVILARQAHQRGEVDGVLALGGSMGTTLGSSVMRALPFGLPKLMISTMASRDTRAFVGTRDIMMLHAVADLSGLNRITRRVLANGAAAMAGMVRFGKAPAAQARPLAAISTLGTTEALAQQVRAGLEAAGREVVIFHTVGSGGEAMDELVREGVVDAVVELSLHELADNLFGGDYDAGPERARAALAAGLPAVLVPGNIDFLVTGPMAKARENFPGRQYHAHNAAITVMKTRVPELERMAAVLADLCRLARGPLRVLVPTRGLSAFTGLQGPFHDPEAMAAFTEAARRALPQGVPARFLDCHINDPAFGEAVAAAFLEVAG